jgi:hypothetical protein
MYNELFVEFEWDLIKIVIIKNPKLLGKFLPSLEKLDLSINRTNKILEKNYETFRLL